MLSMILGASAAAWLVSRLKMILIFAGILVATNAVSGVYWYLKGYNSAATQCKMAEVIREREEARRDLKIAQDTGAQLAAELKRQSTELAEGDRKVQEYADRLKEQERKLQQAERKAQEARPANCPKCPRPRPCVVGPG